MFRLFLLGDIDSPAVVNVETFGLRVPKFVKKRE